METPKILIAYYSRTGITKTVAKAIASQLNCKIDEILDTHDRRGWTGYIRSMIDAVSNRLTILKEPIYYPENYDLVVIGTPVWGGSLSTPVRTYLARHRGHFKNVAFFLTHGGTGEKKTFSQMEQLSGKAPLALLDLHVDEIKLGNVTERISSFSKELRTSLEKRLAV